VRITRPATTSRCIRSSGGRGLPDSRAGQDCGVTPTPGVPASGNARLMSVIEGEPDVTRTCRFVAV
jgi:hypothetical protein